MRETKTKTVIRFAEDDDLEFQEFNYFERANTYYNEPRPAMGYELELAKDFDGADREEIIEAFELVSSFYPHAAVELVKVTITTEVEDVGLDDAEFKELHQKLALAKLSQRDIKALNLVSLAVYIKTKYHEAKKAA